MTVAFVVGGCTSFTSAESGDTDPSDDSTSTSGTAQPTSATAVGTGSGAATTTTSTQTSGVPPTTGATSTSPTTSSSATASTTEDTAAEESSSTEQVSAGVCGDSVPDPGEDCDDGNGDELDGCTAGCLPSPFGISLEDDAQSALDGGSGDVLNDDLDLCPPGEVLVGLEGALTNDGWIGRIRGQCQEAQATNATPPLFGSGGAISLTPTRGGFNEGGGWSTTCPANQVIVAVSGGAGTVVDGLSVQCAGLGTVGREGDYDLELGDATPQPLQGGSGGGPFGPLECPDDGIAVGLRLRTSSYLNQIQLHCQTAGFDY